jgi:zinc protease
MNPKPSAPFIAIMITACLVAAAASSCASGPKTTPSATTSTAGEVVPLVGSAKVHRYTYPNGLKLLVVEDHSSPTFAYQTWFRIGSRDEIPGKTGLAHLFEHMMFKETKNHKEGEFDRILEAVGVEGENAFTNRDYTAYIQELPKNQLDLIASLESDRMVNLLVNEQSFRTELEVVQNERRFRTENNPDGTMYQDLFGLAFEKHPYHWPVIGYQADLDKMSAQNAMDFYKTYYSPNHATIVVVGDVDAGHVHDVIQKYYGGLLASSAPSHDIPVEPTQDAPRRESLKLNIQVEKIVLAYHIPGIADADMPAIDVLQAVLSGGKSSRLYRALVDTGIASSVDSEDIDDKDPTLFIIGVNLQKGRHATQAESVVLREIARLTSELVGDKELERARNKIDFGFYEGLGSAYLKAQFLGKYEALTKNFELGLLEQQRIQSVTPEQIMEVAKKYFMPSNRSVVSAFPKGGKQK